jgi:hypothetical protein
MPANYPLAAPNLGLASASRHVASEKQEAGKRLGHDRRDAVELIARGCPLDEIMRKLIEMVEHQAPEQTVSVVRLDGMKVGFLASSLPAAVVEATDGLRTHLIEECAFRNTRSDVRGKVLPSRPAPGFTCAAE